ncbi:MAG: glycosyltransferase, partial [Lachnospiraceae bacterium]|nr:glycosyltransferase [Lachnospiraceae bacterium]
MKISVVMCTYNGENYIKEQLRTILKQSRKPEEVILCDDRSTDRTTEIIRNFIRVCGLEERWHLYENAENVGWKRNFMEALRRSTGDLIFLADQDDLWHPRKIELMSKACEQHPEIGLLVCD